MQRYFVMTIDVDPPFSLSQNYIIEEGVNRLLYFFDKWRIKTTFFMPALVVQNFPEVTDKIVEYKHEIGCHGLKHNPSETTLSVNKQVRIINAATKIIESFTGIRPIGYRAPLFKCNRNCWIALQKNSYVYDSSYFCSPFFGSKQIFFHMKPFFIRRFGADGDDLLEIPVSINPILPLPLGGGWFRIFGLSWAKIGVKINFIFKNPIVFYIHPKDIIPSEAYGLPWFYYRNNANSLAMLSKIIQYVKQNEVKFLMAYELAKILNKKKSNCT